MNRLTSLREAVSGIRAGLFLLLIACSANRVTEPAPDPRPTVAAFDSFWNDFDRTYSYFTYKNIDWPAARVSFREASASVESDSALVNLFLQAVQPMRDVHIWFRRPDGSLLPSFTPTKSRNWNQQLWLSYLPRLNWQQRVSNWGYGTVDNVGYLAIGAWSTTQVRMDEVDQALEQVRNTRALIIDVRMNGGGNDQLALQLASRFATQPVTFGSVQFRNGPTHDAFGDVMPRVLAPRGQWSYTKPVILLAGRGCFSSNETFIAAMSMLPQVTVAGDTTGGGSGNPIERDVVVAGRNTGWRYSVPRWIERMSDGRVVEWNGVPPDTYVAFDPVSVSSGIDPIIEWALARARQ